MKLAYSSNAYMRHGVDEAIRRVAALGYSGIELMADEPHLWPQTTTTQQRAEARRQLADTGPATAKPTAFIMKPTHDLPPPSPPHPAP
ncbi:MAG: sugar phosphate isomerase/epimerase, partial [bacterium]|nr:sugar phosphate isomerase/epimerase [bacterium]